MIFLESPALAAGKAEWEAWLKQLRTMNQRDSSVLFAQKRAEAVLRRLAEAEMPASAPRHALA